MTSNGSKKLDLRWCWKAALCVLFLSMSTTVQAQRVALRYTNRTSAHINVLEQDSQGLTRRVKHLGPGESFRYQGLGEPQFEMLNGVVTRVVEEKRWGGKFVPVGIALVDFPITDYLNASTQLINRSSSPLEVTYVKRTKFRLDQGVVIYSKRVPENGTLELKRRQDSFHCHLGKLVGFAKPTRRD